ncbi:MotA/TolQ/ExbB proton channel family protein [Novosphingobium mangrovi (ex Huang et al. 2023)]|uniref:MotA/TolQ/ExbB proton channel family protein n=1 Tax=Novosphingobium mangrovi (ex Huang et al. 2023) TaxID=2976432 RepID=A0ABT2I032_9SPHN|nr:MotA/TolQ/ExbB proton channel family protein [Novosphingobium mangrovi (ex Huang et al. 2023)]MCT2398150.1 MotA/TolQ/ExbB proton channel family protein [Novosphingobium mangrovi (ex Huang et al. 2023)]
MQPQNLFDATSALIVVGGTCLATLLRCGLGDTRAALGALMGLGRSNFDAGRVRAQLAVQVRGMQKDGVLRTEPLSFGDAEFTEATDALIGSRSVSALHRAHAVHKRKRNQYSQRAVQTLNQAADLSPVFGLAGTLVSLSQLPAGEGPGGNFTAAISMAVLTTLYGLLLGNLVFAPLARAVARRASDEEQERQDVLDWLEKQVAEALPATQGANVVRHRASAAGRSR